MVQARIRYDASIIQHGDPSPEVCRAVVFKLHRMLAHAGQDALGNSIDLVNAGNPVPLIGLLSQVQHSLESFANGTPDKIDSSNSAEEHDQTTKPDPESDPLPKNKKDRRIRPMTAAAADCARLYRKAKRHDPGARMRHIVNEYAEIHGVSAETIMRVLNDHPDQWKDDQKATKTRPPDDTGRM